MFQIETIASESEAEKAACSFPFWRALFLSDPFKELLKDYGPITLASRSPAQFRADAIDRSISSLTICGLGTGWRELSNVFKNNVHITRLPPIIEFSRFKKAEPLSGLVFVDEGARLSESYQMVLESLDFNLKTIELSSIEVLEELLPEATFLCSFSQSLEWNIVLKSMARLAGIDYLRPDLDRSLWDGPEAIYGRLDLEPLRPKRLKNAWANIRGILGSENRSHPRLTKCPLDWTIMDPEEASQFLREKMNTTL